MSVERQAVDVVRWARVDADCTGAADRDEALARVRGALMASLQDADGRPLACRVTLSGGCAADRALGARPQRLVDEVRAVGLDVGAGQLWIEGVHCETRSADATGDLASRRDPIARLVLEARTQAANPADLLAVLPNLDALTRLLPSGTLTEDHAGPEDCAWLAERVGGAERLILGRLGAGAEAA